MTAFGDLADHAAIARMSDLEYSQYWSALGTVVRIVSRNQAATPQEAAQPRTEINNTAATAERSWTPVTRAPAAPFGFGRAE